LEELTYRSTNPGARTLRKVQVTLYVRRVGKIVYIFKKKEKWDKDTKKSISLASAVDETLE